jgi:DNA-binding SARP family transcriptional activator
LNAAKAVALLALLALARAPQTREQLTGYLWAESTADAARKNLRNTLWTIRRALGDDFLDAEADRLALAADVWVDATAIADFKFQISDVTDSSKIETLKSIIALYRGPLLDGFSLADAPEFELWLTGERERLSQMYLRALSHLVEGYRERQQWREMLDAAGRALAEDNLQEPMYRARMDAHARLGERAEAFREYEALRTILERELGVAPLPETEALREQIVRGQLELLPTSTGSKAGIMPQRTAPARTPFIGRERELASLNSELEKSRGGARVALLAGEVGIGKTRLWQEWLAALPAGANRVVLQAHCLEATQALPFTPVVELFREPAGGRHLSVRESGVPPLWLAEVARVIPELSGGAPSLPPPAPLQADEERRRLFEGFARCLLALNAQPLIVFIDDVHWIDSASLDWLAFILDRLREQPLLLVLAYRPADAPAVLVQRIAQWARAGALQRIAVDHFSEEESAALISALGGDAGLAERAQSQAGGNPYFLIELAQAPERELPLALTELLRARIARLSALARQVLQAAAILDSDFDVSALAQTSGRSESETLDALDELVQAADLIERDAHYGFAHPLIATVVRDDLSGARKAFLHRRAAAALESSQVSGSSAGRIAAHYAQGGDHARAAQFFETAAAHALSVAAPLEAVQFYEQALAHEPTALRRSGLGNALLRLGDLPAARANFLLAYDEFVAANDLHYAAQLSLSVAETFLAAEHFEEGRAWMERSLAHSDVDADPASHALAHLLLGSGRLEGGLSIAEAEPHLVEAIRIAADHQLPLLEARARFTLGNAYAEQGDLAHARPEYELSIALADAARDDFQAILSTNNAAYHALLDHDLAAAHRHIDAALARAEARALRIPLQYLFSTRGELALAEEQFDEAEQWFARALSEAQRNGNEAHVANTLANQGMLARARGDLDEALVLFNRARTEASRLPVPHLQAQIALRLAELYGQRGERMAADESLRQAEALLANGERRRLKEWAQQLRLMLT